MASTKEGQAQQSPGNQTEDTAAGAGKAELCSRIPAGYQRKGGYSGMAKLLLATILIVLLTLAA